MIIGNKYIVTDPADKRRYVMTCEGHPPGDRKRVQFSSHGGTLWIEIETARTFPEYEDPKKIEVEDRLAHDRNMQDPIYKVIGFGHDEKGNVYDYLVGYYRTEEEAEAKAAEHNDSKVKLDTYMTIAGTVKL